MATTTASAASGRGPAAADPAPTACPNCFAPLAQPAPPFCPQCGQETRVRAPLLGEFIQQFGGAYLSTEGALWRTLGLLLARPGELTRRYLAGRRKHYVLPLRLYLTISVIVLLVLRSMAEFNIGGPVAQADVKDLQNFRIDLGVGRAGLTEGRFYCENLPPTICKRLERRLDLDPKSLQREVNEFGSRLLANLGTAMFVLVPMFALWSKLLWLDRRLRYTEHLVFALHLHAFWFLAVLAMALGHSWVSGLAALAMPVYALWAARRVYGGRWWSLLLRTSTGAVLYLLTLGMVMAGLAVVTLLF